MRGTFVFRSGVSRSTKKLHRVESSNMLLIFSPFKGWFCAFPQGWRAHISVIFLPCLPLRAGGRASMRSPRQFRGPYGLSPLGFFHPMIIYMYIYLSLYLYISIYIYISLYCSSLSLSTCILYKYTYIILPVRSHCMQNYEFMPSRTVRYFTVPPVSHL
jgi:hypothetical protein